MDHWHRRFTTEQVKVLLQGYCQGSLTRSDAEEMLAIGKTRFFAWLYEYRRSPQTFSIAYDRETSARLSASVERAIETELRREQGLVEDRRLPISDYSYSTVRDRLTKKGITVSVTTIIDRAKKLGCYKPHRKGKAHDRQVLTTAIGALVQHDASQHLGSPFAEEKWTRITSIDDYSRKLLFADFFGQQTTCAYSGSANAHAGVWFAHAGPAGEFGR
jgi:hypothetical protein